jgi:phosphoglycolate phosphatase
MTTTEFSPRAVLFDLDGTLIESAPEIADAVNDTLQALNWSSVSQTLVNDWIGHGTRELLIKALAHVSQLPIDWVRQSEWLPNAFRIFEKHYRQRCGTRSRVYPHVKETLSKLQRNGVRLAVVTNKEAIYTQIVLDVHHLTSLFDIVISGDTLETKKPDPQGVFYCLAQWQIAPQEALFVGDSSIDAQTAKAAGIQVWLLPYGYNMGDPISACHPDRVIQDFSQLQFNMETTQ